MDRLAEEDLAEQELAGKLAAFACTMCDRHGA